MTNANRDEITIATMQWAHVHDWGRAAYLLNAYDNSKATQICGLENIWQDKYKSWHYNTIAFTSREALRRWAGY